MIFEKKLMNCLMASRAFIAYIYTYAPDNLLQCLLTPSFDREEEHAYESGDEQASRCVDRGLGVARTSLNGNDWRSRHHASSTNRAIGAAMRVTNKNWTFKGGWHTVNHVSMFPTACYCSCIPMS